MTESISDFYKRIQNSPAISGYSKEKEYFDVQPSQCRFGKTSFSYRDFYKVGLVMDTGKLYFADKWILVDRPAILFSNPLIPYAWEAISPGKEEGCFCIFNEAFTNAEEKNSSLADTPLFDTLKERIYFLDDESLKNIQGIFRKMQVELNSGYAQKLDIMRCYLHLLIHEAMKIQQISQYVPHKNAAQRIVELFLTLLDRQFPIEIPRKSLVLKTATDYANRLSVHVNHLNRVVKASTGKTTSELIINRIIQEGVTMLRHTTYSIAEIAFGLGFEEPSSFSNFVKKHTGISPTEHRIKPDITRMISTGSGLLTTKINQEYLSVDKRVV